MAANNMPFGRGHPVVASQDLAPYVVAHAQPVPPKRVNFPAGMVSGSVSFQGNNGDVAATGTPLTVLHLPAWLRRGV